MIKVFCLPYAGSSGTNYLKFIKLFSDHIQLIPLELPGRGVRFKEDLVYSISDMVDSVYPQIIEELEDCSTYAIWGHSMGGLIAFELIQQLLSDEGIKIKPSHAFFTGCKPPQRRTEKEGIADLTLEEFKQRVLAYGLVNTSLVFEDPNLSNIFIPIMRSDFIAVDRYEFNKNLPLLNINITSMTGTQDPSMTLDDCYAWQELTTGVNYVHHFNGNHFFIFDDVEKIASIIEKTLQKETLVNV
ncbi:thioesterase II family protein [Niallia sp. Krafla_26]|uniref:thioesterase II family protein n=1 Tax=Niallia sp. Krafla_26 TaxID=3064703 RepID=UPI003D168E1E